MAPALWMTCSIGSADHACETLYGPRPFEFGFWMLCTQLPK